MDKISSLENRIAKNYKKLKKWLNKSSIEAYRLYDKDIPEYPYLIDIYKDYAVVFERGKKIGFEEEAQAKREENHLIIKQSLSNVLGIKDEFIIFKTRRIIDRSKEQYEKNDEENQEEISFTVREEDFKFKINLTDYLDSGLFLDHRWLRRKLKNESKHKHCLNLYCYTGSITQSLLYGGAKYVDSVDLSNTYLGWAQENTNLNFPNKHNYNFIRNDVFDYLKEDHEYYDLIICDPPSFSNSKKMRSEFDVQRDQIGLINLCMKNLKRSGKLYFSTNNRKFRMAPEISEKYNVNNLSQASFDQDFKDLNSRYLFEITFKIRD